MTEPYQAYIAPLVGRASELTQIASLFEAPTCRLLTLLGPGGIGKTRLAFHAAEELAARFSAGWYFVSCASLTSADFIPPAIAEAVGLSLFGTGNPLDQIVSYLRDKHMLLVIDNFDLFTSDAPILARLIEEAPRIKLLVTSRERLGLAVEWVFDVRGLSYPPTTTDEALDLYAAPRLFELAARRARTDFSLAGSHRSAVVRICQRVEGMPLALELAASWVRVLAPTEIANEMDRNANVLAARWPDRPDRHTSIRAAFDYSWNRLSVAERQVFKRLSVFRGVFSREAAEAVAGATLPILSSLVDKSLVRYHTGLVHELC